MVLPIFSRKFLGALCALFCFQQAYGMGATIERLRRGLPATLPVVPGIGGPATPEDRWSNLPRDKNGFPTVNGMPIIPVTGSLSLDSSGSVMHVDPKDMGKAIAAGMTVFSERLPEGSLGTAVSEKFDKSVELVGEKFNKVGQEIEAVKETIGTAVGKVGKEVASVGKKLDEMPKKAVREFAENEDALRRVVRTSTDELSKTPFVAEVGNKIEEKAALAFKKLDEASHRLVSTVFNYRNARQVATPIMAAMSGIAGTWVFWLWAKKRVLNPKPTVLLPGASVGWLDQLKRKWNKYKTPEMIFPAQVKARLQEVCDKTLNIKKRLKEGKKAEYLNIILDGPPGTGKTLFAQVFADRMDMDFAPLTAGSLLQPGAGVAYLNELVDMANRSSRGVVIFIDEAEALLIDRNKLQKDSEHYLVFNHLLSLIGQGNNKFVVVAATNKKSVIDPAMARRFQERINMPLPNEESRTALFKLYINELLFDSGANGEKFVQVAKSLLAEDMIHQLVQQTEGLSGSEIKDSVKSMRDKAFVSADGLLKREHILSAIQECIDKKKAFEDGVDS